MEKVDIIFDDGEKADIIDMVGEFNWMESIDSPFYSEQSPNDTCK